MSEHMSDPSTTSTQQSPIVGEMNGNGKVRGDGAPDGEPGGPKRSRGGISLPLLLLTLVLGIGGGVGGFAIANEVWDDGGADSGSFPIRPANPGEERETVTEPADEGERLTPGQIYDLAGPSVVHITTRVSVTEDSFFGPQRREGQGSGSGFVIDEEGHMVTNAHVVENANEVNVSFDGQQQFEAEVVGEDPSTDLAVIKVDPDQEGLEDALTSVSFGDSSALRVGDPVVAIGNPFNLDRTLTTGVVSALQRRIPALDDFTISNVIQTDAAVNPGNSGGPLLNMRGEVIGVNSQIQSQGGDFAGIAFAVPSKTVTRVAEQLIEDGQAQHAWLGVVGTPLEDGVSELFRLPVEEGVLVAEVSDGSPADRAGLRGGERDVTIEGTNYTIGGDIITKVDGKELKSMQQLVDIVNSQVPGDELEIEYYRGDDRKTATVKLADRPTQGDQGD